MTGNDRPTSVLQRPEQAQAWSEADAALPRPREPQGTARTARTAPTFEDQPTPSRPMPRGWATPEDRRMTLWALAAFAALGLYAVAFVLLGTLVWS